MNQDRWNIVNRIFHSALEVEPSRRRELVLAQANGDPELQAEVEQLLHADADAGSYFERPLSFPGVLPGESYRIVAGDILCGRFRIVCEIAEGGMGQVFEAFDTDLAVRVALKVIRSEIAANSEAAARFLQEVRLARSITHPNICRTYDLERDISVRDGRSTEIVFLTMEFLAGETLASSIKRAGPIPVAEALAIANQIAAALHAAHSLGITHRDMKPANIMLVPPETPQQSLRVVVTDFGLARLDPLFAADGLSAFTRTGQPIGTLAYMAPEQLEGNAVSKATDIYAFGLILFEMITGTRAFPSDNPLSGIAQRLGGAFPLDRLLPGVTPASWRLVLRQCLAVKPSDRPGDATDVVRMLQTSRIGVSLRVRHSVTSARRHLPRTIAVVAACLVAMALFFYGLRLYRTKPNPAVATGALVYLTPVKNQTGEKSLDSVTELIQAGLAQSVQINLLDQGLVGDLLQQMVKKPDTLIDATIAREIGWRAGVARVVFATLSGSRDQYKLDVEIQQLDSTPTRYRQHWTRSFAWQLANNSSAAIPVELLQATRQASDWIRQQVGESANDIARLNQPPEDVTTDRWDALSEYLHALQLQHDQHPDQAVVALHRAILIDTNFALAYGMLADEELTLHHEAEGFAAYQRALDPNLGRRLSRRERDRIEGMYAVDSWDFAAAVDAFRDYQTFYPNDTIGLLYTTYPLMMLGRNLEAVANLKHAHLLDPTNPYILGSLAGAAMVSGELEAAHSYLDQANALRPTSRATENTAQLAALEGDYSRAEALFTSLETSSDSRERSRAFEMRADLLAERGRYREALQILEAGSNEDAATGNAEAQSAKLVAKASLLAALGDFNASLSAVRAAERLDPSPQQMLLIETVLGTAIQAAPSMQSQPLRTEMIALTQRKPAGNYGVISHVLALRNQAERKLAAGEVDSALQDFRNLAAIDAPAGPRDYLGRALCAAAVRQPGATAVRQLRQQALQAYAAIALHPSLVWASSYMYPPGFLADQLQAYLRLADLLGDRSAEVTTARSNLAALRGSPAYVSLFQSPTLNASQP